MPTYKPVSHVLFDLDGTLLDSERLLAELFETILPKYGAEFTKEERVKLMGRTSSDMYKIIIEDYQLPVSLEDFTIEIEDQFHKMQSDSELLPGVEELITHLKSHNVPMAVATSSKYIDVQVKTMKHKHIFDMMNHITCGGSDPEVKNGKPEPDIFLVCASRFPKKPSPIECLVFEDAPNGVQAAVSANMQVVMIPNPIVPEEQRKLATKVISSLVSFQPEEFGLPEFDTC